MTSRFPFLLYISLLGCLLLAACGKEETVPANQAEVHVLMGQSNCLGRAHAYQLPEALQQPLQGCYIYNTGSGQFELIEAGVNTLAGKGMFGPVVKAAQLLHEHQQRDVYFVVTGTGNSQLYNSGSKAVQDWNPDSGELLEQSKKTIEQARLALEKEGKVPVFRTIAWWQGETDGMDAAKAEAYQANEQALFSNLDQVTYLSNTRRVVFKIFSDMKNLPYAATVNAGKAKRAASDKRTLTVIETNSYDRIPQDRLHATALGQVQAGTDLFNAIKNAK